MDLVKKRRFSEESVDSNDSTKRRKHDSKDCRQPHRSLTLLEKLRQNRGKFQFHDGVLIGPCVLCNKKLSLSWYDWKHHYLEHTDEKQFYCFECNVEFSLRSEHKSCSDETIIDVFGKVVVGCALDGFICQLCDYFQINDCRMIEHFNQEHENLLAFNDIHVARVTLVPDVCPEERIIRTGFAYIPRGDRYKCGVGYCSFHSEYFGEYSDHFFKAHSIFKTFFCPHCKLLINRRVESTVAIQNVLTHIESHGSCLHQCFYCELIVTTEAEIRDHIIDEHSDESQLKFWRNLRVIDGVADSEKIEIVLDCALCGERVKNIASVYEHFKEAHAESTIDFKSLKLIKATTSDLKVTRSIDDSVLNYCEVLVCGMCNEYFHNNHRWLMHYTSAHPAHALTVKRAFKWLNDAAYAKKEDIDFDRNMLFFCKFCENSTGKKLMCSSTTDGIYRHWKNVHKRNDKKPFQFYMTELVACNYCNIMSTFDGLKEHVAKSHPNEAFVAIKAFHDTKQCALCNYAFDELTEHFQTEHHLAVEANVLNPIPLSNENLLRLLQISVHKKFKCEYCKEVFETRDEYRTHHSTKHIKLEKLSEAFVDRESVKLIGDCCHIQIDPNSFHDHLEYHKYILKCESCSYRTDDPFYLMKHKIKTHGVTEDASTMYLNFIQLRYWRSELIFGNGLVVNKFNTQGTEYDYSRSFGSFLARLMAEKGDYDRIKREKDELD
ncbi:uncharacterized protein LOC116346160 [Contarinia nasturtii]|uniref:uncharacterized protein LOC116346160 n=1 Tax=Contarinia nasturtii TaxID=265458 RepID=UPI0012D40851|nr:uncharacterized protein LOC116346160 [Contarinia nasturtii]